MKLLIATRNVNKGREIEALLSELDVTILTLHGFPDAPQVLEDGQTFEENACKKAAQLAVYSGLHTVADDSGLCVDALGGRPGVMSARYAGPDPTTENLCTKLLKEMEAVPDSLRAGHFQCHVAFAEPSGHVLLTASGRCNGTITRRMRGRHGFGYDPVFLYVPAGKTFAEMEPAQKNAVSHRGRALREFREKFRAFLASRKN